jgi:acyl-coenzyme A synthetase/AMP-(fatty) acid ligase
MIQYSMIKDYFANLPDFDYPNFAYLFNDVTERFPEREALRYRSGKARDFSVWTYRRMRDEVYAVARFLAARGSRRATASVSILKTDSGASCISRQ